MRAERLQSLSWERVERAEDSGVGAAECKSPMVNHLVWRGSGPTDDEQVLNTMPFQDQTEGRPEWAFWGRLKLDRASSRPTKNSVKPTTLGLGHPSLRTLRKTSFPRFQAARIL